MRQRPHRRWCIAVATDWAAARLAIWVRVKPCKLFRQLARQQRGIAPESVAHNLRDAPPAHLVSYRLHETTCLWARVNDQGHGVAGQAGDGLLRSEVRCVQNRN